MPLYSLSKSPVRVTYPAAAISLLSIHKSKILLAISYVLITTGFFLIGNALYPIVAYEIFTSREISQDKTPKVLVQNIVSPYQVLAESPPDLTNADNWFPQSPGSRPETTTPGKRPDNIEFYNLSIPKLGIKNAVVSIGGTDLNTSLIQYNGTAHPGQLGNPVIFGHSVLPQFFNPKNYISIFSTLPTLKVGDTLLVDYDGIQYKYQVFERKEVKPADVSVLEQRYDRRELSLVTCVPPGTYLRRLIIKTKLVENK